ncbi:MAG: hypothetical protein HOF21_03520 [Nitrospina sp.]|jgi:hypothetical protein|nr:hypothetical protein [Nitrospina sp.]MBT5631319.1 hypothetical protein [Nitrospina sp.]
MYKPLLGAIGIGLTFFAYLPYIRSIVQGKTRPHVFSWVIWGTSTCIVFLAQLTDKGGAGAWVIGVSGIISIYVAILAYLKRSDSTITRIDWLFFILAMTSLPLWYLTSDPLWAVVLLTTVDVLGFGPTFRRAYIHPFEEQLMFYVIMAVRNLIVVLALENYSLTTVLFPATIAVVCLIFSLMVVSRRRVVA